MNKPFHKPSVKKPPHVKKFSTQRYSSLCRDSKCPTIWMLVHCGAGTSLGPQLGTSRLSGRPAFGLTPSEPRGPSLRPLGSSCPSVNSIHSWVFTITALGAVVLSKELFFFRFKWIGIGIKRINRKIWSWHWQCSLRSIIFFTMTLLRMEHSNGENFQLPSLWQEIQTFFRFFGFLYKNSDFYLIFWPVWIR